MTSGGRERMAMCEKDKIIIAVQYLICSAKPGKQNLLLFIIIYNIPHF